MDVRELIKERVVVFDGAMGTMLQKRGLKLGENPEIINFTNEEAVIDIHKEYIKAGADIITTNTFGANEIKLKNTPYSVEAVITKAVTLAKKASFGEDVLVALDIGPIGELIEPMGTLSFDNAVNIFKRIVKVGEKAGVDLILIETMTDLYEMKAAILACKEETSLPIFATMTFEEDGRTFTGCLPESMAITLEALGVDVLGVNCSLGPKELLPIVKRVIASTNIPVMIQPNAGLPKIVDDETIYDITALEFSEKVEEFIKSGVSIVGGCCGTTPEFIEELSKLKNLEILDRNNIVKSVLTTHSKVVEVDEVKVVGERINPTGKKLFKEALKKNDLDYILRQAIEQVEAGANLLDVNVGLPEINEEETIVKVIKEIQSILDIPLQIDSNDPKVIEKALRYYNGKPIVNSVNG
ncbi:homocysteine S-methyltransferase family protein, partial [Clostridium saudiense]|nr:homocysteine S-methyltransferase family protein [Clostridium saudiense]